jgi:general secretion pathway protein E
MVSPAPVSNLVQANNTNPTQNRPIDGASTLLLGELLVALEKVSAADVDKALGIQRDLALTNPSNPTRLGAILLRLGAISEEVCLGALSMQTGMPLLASASVDTAKNIVEPPDAAAIEAALAVCSLPAGYFASANAVPWLDASNTGVVYLMATDVMDASLAEQATEAFSSYKVQLVLARAQDIEHFGGILTHLTAHLATQKRGGASGNNASNNSSALYLREMAEEAPIIELVNNVLAQAVDEGASDVHIEPAERNFEVRYRIDGVLQTRMQRPRDRFEAVASRVKLIAGLDIAERRLPQDGRVTTRVSGMALDIRVSTLPGVHGESIVMRLLPKERGDLSLDSLGLEPDHLQSLRSLLQQPNGLVLVTGPTGSGKSTTLYSALAQANDRRLKIVTVEDPVEYRMSGVTQIQTHAEIGYTFARALRSILRHDPDVIMIGEIRDRETAEIAIQSALTGHLVLATLHTNDAPSAFTRMLEMGIEPFLLSTSVRAVMAQRLVRKILPAKSTEVAEANLNSGITAAFKHLKKRFPASFAAPAKVRAPNAGVADAVAYKGRMGIYELLTVTPAVQDAILRQASGDEIAEIARNEAPGNTTPYRTLREDGLIKAWQGKTGIDEVLRVAGEV